MRRKAALFLLILLAWLGAGYAVRIVVAEHKLWLAIKHHANDLEYSLRVGKEAADMLPYRFEMQYVQGWLGYLARDTSRIYFRRSTEAAPYFPPPYRYLEDR